MVCCTFGDWQLTKLEVGVGGADVVESTHEALDDEPHPCRNRPRSSQRPRSNRHTVMPDQTQAGHYLHLLGDQAKGAGPELTHGIEHAKELRYPVILDEGRGGEGEGRGRGGGSERVLIQLCSNVHLCPPRNGYKLSTHVHIVLVLLSPDLVPNVPA